MTALARDLHSIRPQVSPASFYRPASSQTGQVPRVVIVGAGFGGLSAAMALRRAPSHVTVIDRRNHHLFQPLLYQVATAALSPADIAQPIRSILRRQRNATVLLGRVTGLDRDAREVLMDERRVPYDYLVVATGARHAYFGHAPRSACARWRRTSPPTGPTTAVIRRAATAAYHQGTVWPWLIGPFVEAWLRVQDGYAAIGEVDARFLQPIRDHLGTAGLGHIAEIADADPPHTPRGCPFQAWSLGELLRVSAVIETGLAASQSSAARRSA
jgi:NADPH-dependent 2,4-dienoyl-CoA reductase/sulfur reductase-like enzyme